MCGKWRYSSRSCHCGVRSWTRRQHQAHHEVPKEPTLRVLESWWMWRSPDDSGCFLA